MTLKKYRTIEEPRGTGNVYKDDQLIARARYVLTVRQKITVARTIDGAIHEIPGLVDMAGQVTVLDGQRDLFNEGALTLQLADGRRWDFWVRYEDPIKCAYVVSGSLQMTRSKDSHESQRRQSSEVSTHTSASE